MEEEEEEEEGEEELVCACEELNEWWILRSCYLCFFKIKFAFEVNLDNCKP